MKRLSQLRQLGSGLILALGCTLLRAGEGTNAPLAQRYALTLEPVAEVEPYGPLGYWAKKDTEVQWGVPPLFTSTRDRAVEAAEFDFVYPVFTYDRFGAEYRFQFLQLLSFSGGHDQEAVPTGRVTVFPIFFHQSSADTNRNYTAVFPVYGHLKHRLMRDDIRFALFPLYARSRKQDVVTDNYLYPFFHVRRGQGLSGWQIWPLLGHEHKLPTTRTNTLDEVETVGGHDKSFAFWPIFFREDTGVGTDNPEKLRAVIPLFTKLRSPQRDSTTYLWPLFTVTHDRAKNYREWDAPWPLIVFARGPGKTANRVWPLFSHAANTNLQSDFLLWPLYKYNRFQSDAGERERTRILFFLYSDIVEKVPGETNAFQRTDLWPLFTARRDRDGTERLQLLSVLEPLLTTSKSIERNYSPVWALWRSERNRRQGTSSHAVLWNLYRRDVSPTTKKCSLLFGLFQYQSSPEGQRWRLFYLPLGKGKPTRPPPAKA